MRIIYTGSNTEEWLRLRGDGLGASDAPIYMGLSHFCSPMALYAMKLGIIESPEATGPMIRGHECEVIIAGKLQKDKDLQAMFPGALVFPDQRLVGSDEREFMLSTQDAFLEWREGKILCEFKCPNYAYKSGRFQEGVPDDIYAQCQGQVYVSGEDRVILAVLPAGAWSLYWTIIKRNDDFINTELLPAADKFWGQIQERVPPEFIGMECETKAINAINSPEVDEVVDLDIELADDLDTWNELEQNVKDLTRQISIIQGKFRKAIGTAKGGILPDRRYVSNKPNKHGQRTLKRKKEAVIVSMK